MQHTSREVFEMVFFELVSSSNEIIHKDFENGDWDGWCGGSQCFWNKHVLVLVWWELDLVVEQLLDNISRGFRCGTKEGR